MLNNNQIINIKPKKVALILGFIVTLLVFASIAGQLSKFIAGHDYIYGLVDKFNLDEERNIPTYFSSFLLLFSAFLLSAIAVLKRKKGDPYSNHWALLSIIFLYLSIDESIGIHELWIGPMRDMFSAKGIFYFAWVIPGILLFFNLCYIFL